MYLVKSHNPMQLLPKLKNNASIVNLAVTGDASFNSDVSFNGNLDIVGNLKIKDRGELGEITQSNTAITKLKNNASIVNLAVTGDASFNIDVSFTGNVDIEGVLKF